MRIPDDLAPVILELIHYSLQDLYANGSVRFESLTTTEQAIVKDQATLDRLCQLSHPDLRLPDGLVQKFDENGDPEEQS